MTTETILTDEQIAQALNLAGVTDYADVPLSYDLEIARAIEQAVLQSPEVQALRDLLKVARQQLPLAAQFWRDDDEPERASRNVGHVMKLIAEIDAVLAEQASTL